MLTQNDLLVLGFLLERPMHGYEISQAFKTADVDTWFEISTASIYYSLNKLRHADMIAEARSRGSSRERTIYHVTAHGRDAFFSGIETLLDSTTPIRTSYDLGIYMLNRLSHTRATELLKKRVDFLNEWRTQLESKYAAADKHRLQQAILQHAISTANLDIEWLTGIMQQLEDPEACESDTQSLMTLHGQLQDFHLPDLIKLLASSQQSGTLVIEKETHQCSITFQDGVPHCAASTQQSDIVIDPVQVLDNIYNLFRWQKGTYTFDQRGCPQQGCVQLQTSADNLILIGTRRLDNWNSIQRIVPNSDVLFERRDNMPHTHLELHTDETHILNTIDGLKDVTAIAREADLTEFETSKVLYSLYNVGLVQPADPDKSRLRRVFREFAELMCRSAIPYRADPEEATLCEQEVNRRCHTLPVRIADSHIQDDTDANLQTEQLAEIYRTFLQTQYRVLTERLGQNIADELRQQVMNRINPDLLTTLEQYKLL